MNLHDIFIKKEIKGGLIYKILSNFFMVYKKSYKNYFSQRKTIAYLVFGFIISVFK